MATVTPRQAAVVLVLSAAAAGVLALSVPVLHETALALRSGHAGTLGFDEVLVSLCALASTVGGAWCWAGSVSLALSSPARLQETSGLALPLVLRRAVLTACGTALVASGAGVPSWAGGTPESTAAGPTGHAAGPSGVAATPGLEGPDSVMRRLVGLPLPDRAEGGEHHRASAGRSRSRDLDPTGPRPAQVVVVRPGDSLWSIAERLGTSPVDQTWRALIAANADRLEDPDLIRPGERLAVPPPSAPPV